MSEHVKQRRVLIILLWINSPLHETVGINKLKSYTSYSFSIITCTQILKIGLNDHRPSYGTSPLLQSNKNWKGYRSTLHTLSITYHRVDITELTSDNEISVDFKQSLGHDHRNTCVLFIIV